MEESRAHNLVRVIYSERCQSICRVTCLFKQWAWLVTTCFDPMSSLFLVCAKKSSLIRVDKTVCESPTHLIRALGKIPDIFALLKHVSVCVYDEQKYNVCLVRDSQSWILYYFAKKDKNLILFLTTCMVTVSWINKPPAHKQIRYPLKLHTCLKNDLGLPPNLLAAQK